MPTVPQTADEFLVDGSDAFHASLATQLEASLGTSLPQMEIRFRDLTIGAEVVLATKDGHELPTLLNHAKKMVLGLVRSKRSVRKDILHPMTGVFKPRTTTLLLGQPSSGKSSLMKFLSGRFPMHRNISVDGTVTYNGVSMAAIKSKLPQFISYVGQRDYHYPTLTVKEALAFAHACSGGADVPPHVRDQLIRGTGDANAHAHAVLEALYKSYPDIITHQMGLKICENTIVGNGMLRGVSGGERKRVTTGEMEFGMKQVSFMDEISTGLDSAATFDITKSQKSMAESLKKTIVIALLQPSPEVYNLFDDVLLLNDGYVMYHGPRAACLEYFEALGFTCPPKRDVADFLLDLGTPQQDQYVSSATTSPPRTPHEYADVFKASAIYKAMIAHMDAPQDATLDSDAAGYMTLMPNFRVSFAQSTKELVRRQLRVFLRNRAFVKSRIVMVLLMGLLYSSTFYQLDPQNPMVVIGVIFTAVLFLAMGQVPMMPAHLEARDIYYKQSSARFYRTFSFILAQSFTQVPFAVLETAVFGSVMYWLTGFVNHASHFLTYLLMLYLTNLSFASWFFFIAMVSPDLHVAKPLSMLTVLVFVLFAGFIISPSIIPDYFIWIYWMNPLSWCIRSLTINQFSASDFQGDSYGGINYKLRKGDTMGNTMLRIFDFPTTTAWIWYGAIYLAASYFIFLGFSYCALEYVRYDAPENVSIHLDEDASGGKAAPKSPPKNHVVVEVDPATVPATPVTLAFQDLWYSVPNPKKGEPDLKLLKGVNGYAVPGTITALMGSSGAGKTTLMDVIAGRKTGGKIDGRILLNGYPATDLAIRRATGYCEQMDIHCESATFREALQFSAMLRQKDSVPSDAKLAFAEKCLEVLDMVNLGDQIIRGSSVEQMKRLTIGVELAASPSVLFLDEPTSGLDARSAKIIMSGIRKIASTGRTVVCTIHQPSTEVFEMFDNLLLLKRGGETVFFGQLGANASNLIKYFSSIPGTPPIQPGANPATWMLECIGAGVEARHTDGPQVDYVAAFAASDERKQLTVALAGHTTPQPSLPELKFSSKRAASSRTQFVMLSQRFFRMYWRTPTYNFTRAMMSIILAVLFGLVYRGVDYGTYIGATGGVGMVFMTSLFVGMISFNSVLPLASEERASFYRERASQTYNALWYFVGSTLAEIPYVFVSTYIFTIIYYPFVGFHESVGACAFYGLNLSLLVLMNVYFGQLMAYAMPRVDVAALVGVLLNSIFFLFMGYNPPASQIPSGYRWLYTITPPKYSVALLVAETFSQCTDGTQLGCRVMPSSGIPLSLSKALNKTDVTVKEYIEYMYEMKADDRWTNFFVVIGIIVLWRILALITLVYVNHQKR
ncbi:ATP-binding Cassette (ABC) Superfamily [Achlya hypogyna]|uniref:ATP-binding Cassette (ABC) Superfamily n=1 Tax=Achlya hypogyna TaxID=1202772 RepID=A0A1V9YHQ5_ACHHY|nr:ATP-binding Cassette (ABC) Superfamily [Achlya hypogyna]